MSKVSRFSPEQQEVIDIWGVGMAVLAGAGSGKTTTLVEKCTQLVQRQPEARFVAVSFTERSAGDLKAKLTASLLELGRPVSVHWMTTIHGLCASVIKEFPKEAGLNGEETVLPEAEAQIFWTKAIDSLWIEDIPEIVRMSLEFLLNRETRDSLIGLLNRVKALAPLGVLEVLSQSNDPSTLALGSVATYALDRLKRQKRRLGFLDFGDLELSAFQALEVPTVRQSYHRRFELVLVDEFQDTNPLQAKIIRHLARPNATNLCVIGDPKQSIYRFRDADVSVFEEFCRHLPICKSLTWNFRSLSGIIEFTNVICEKLFAASQLNFEPLVPKKNVSKLVLPENTLITEPLPESSESGAASVIRLNIHEPQELADWLHSQVNRGVPLHQFTLLVRRIRGNEKWFKALQSAGIPLAIGSGGLFWDDPRVRELVSFLKWWNCEANTLSGAIFLRAPWMGIADEELDRWVREDPTWKTPFFQSSHRIAKKLAPLRDRIVRPGELLLALLSDLGESESESELGAPLLGLWHRVEELSSRGMDFSAVVTEIAAAMKENRREREVPAPRNLGQLSVLTLHGAKGLEFDQVILIDFGISRRRSDAPLLFWDRTLGVYLGKRDESGNRQPKNPQEQSWRDLEKKKNLAESKRLFYVALTRAKERLILVCTGESSQESTDSSVESIYSCDDWRGWIDRFAIPIFEINSKNGFKSLPKAHHSQRYPIFQGGSNLANPSWFEQKRPRHSVTEWNLLSRCPRAYEWTYIHSKKKQNPLDQSPSKSGSPLKGVQAEDSLVRQAFQELGTQVHACLASGDDEGLKALESNSSLKDLQGLRFSSAPVIEWRRKSSWMAPANRVMGRDVWVELPFEVPVYGETLVGSIDRLILEKRGSTSSYSLLDFKVTQSFKRKDILLEAYGTQLLLYTMALTILDPKIRWTDIDAALVNVTPAGVQVLAVPVQRDSHRVHELADLAGRIVNGHSGEPKCGPLCQFCEFLDSCQEGKLYLGKTSVVTDSSESDTYELESGQTDLNFSQRSPNVSWFT